MLFCIALQSKYFAHAHHASIVGVLCTAMQNALVCTRMRTNLASHVNCSAPLHGRIIGKTSILLHSLMNYVILLNNGSVIYYTIVLTFQFGLMIGSILGPGTIFLMLVGAFATAFNLGQWDSFVLNFVPIGIFLVVCYFCKSDVQVSSHQ